MYLEYKETAERKMVRVLVASGNTLDRICEKLGVPEKYMIDRYILEIADIRKVKAWGHKNDSEE